jgi:hypothetical protein
MGCEKSRDMGVTWLCVGFAVWMWLFHPGTVVGFGSRKEEYVDKIGDPKSIFWKIRQFIALLPVEFRPAGYIESRHAPHMRIINPENGLGDHRGGRRQHRPRQPHLDLLQGRERVLRARRSRSTRRCRRPRTARWTCRPPNGRQPVLSKRHGGSAAEDRPDRD